MGNDEISDPEVLEELFVPDDSEGSAPDLEPTFGETLHFEGRYEVDPIPGGKRFQGSWLVLGDGSRYLLSYRPVPDHFCFLNKRVCVRGRPYVPGRDVQHMGATHLNIESIELAAGEVPYDQPPVELPLPPVVRRESDLVAKNGRWVRVVGTVVSVGDDPEGQLGLARIQLADGCEIVARNALRSRWEGCVGQTVTVMSRVSCSHRGCHRAPELIGWCEISSGDPEDASARRL